MTKVNVRIGQTQFHTIIPADSFKDIQEIHDGLKKMYPDEHVNFVWGPEDNRSFIYGMPYNQELDELKVDRGEMIFEEFECKWYPYLGMA